jgi:hypothetical protein
MPRIEKPKGFKVVIIESEAGWGSKVDDELYFDNEPEAIQYVKDYNDRHNPPLKKGESVPSWYMIAQYLGAV